MYGSLLYKFLVLIFILLISQSGATEIIDVDEKTEVINIASHSEIFIDSVGHYTYENVSKELFGENFIPVKSKSVSAGYTSDVIWMRFSLKNNSDKVFHGKLEIPMSWVNKLDVYMKTDETLSVKKLGADLALEKIDIDSKSFFVQIIIQPSTSSTIYLKAEGTNAITLTPRLYSQKNATEHLTYVAMFNGLLVGVILIIFLYNLKIYFVLKDENYLYYMLYIMSLLFFMDAYYGYNLQVFLINTPIFKESISSAIVAFSLYVSLLFTRGFLQSTKNFPKSDTYLSVIMYAFAVLCIFSLIIDNNLLIVYATILLIVIYSLAMIYISIVSLIKKVSGSGYILLASLLSAVSLLLSSAVAMGFVYSNDYIHNFYGIAIIFNILLLSFALVSRTEDIQIQNESVIKKEHEMVNKLGLSKDELIRLNEKLKRKLDIRDKQLLEKEMEFEQFSIKDNVTGLYNRVKLEELLSKELHRSKRYNHEFSLIIINIDSMKIINDSHGYEVGNSVIKEMSDLLLNHIRYIDTVGRWSDDDYLVICPETNIEHAVLAAQHLQKLVESNKFFFVGGVTVSLGVTVSHEEDTEKYIVDRVYEALAKAKENGKNRVETA